MFKLRKMMIIILMSVLLFGNYIQAHASLNPDDRSTPTGIPFTMVAEEIDAFMAENLGETAPGAGVAVFADGEIIFTGFYGYANLEEGVPMSADTVFEYGSIGKLLTYVAVMQLVEQGLIDLDAPMSNYLPADFYRQLRHTEPFTMRDLLNHAAGFGQNMFNNFVVTTADDLTVPEITLEETLLRINPPQIYSPGTGSAYSNFGITLAGFAVEYVSGKQWYQYQWEHIIDPVGMTQSALLPDWRDNPQILENKAEGYMPTGAGNFRNAGWFSGLAFPAGNINGTVEDLALFGMALMPDADTPLFENEETLDLLLSPSYDEDGDMVGTYHGFLRTYVGERLSLGHGGNTVGFTANLSVIPQENFGFVVSVNGGQEQLIIEGLYDLLIQDLSQIEQPAVRYDDLPSVELVTGSYVALERSVGNILEVLEYFQLISVEAVDENENQILVGIRGGEAIFTQVEPYVFELAEVLSLAPPTWRIMNRIEFRMDDDTAVFAIVGGWDFTPLPSGRTMPILLGSLAVVLLNVLLLIIAPLVLVIKLFRKKKDAAAAVNKPFARFQLATILASLALIMNIVVLVVRVGADPFRMIAAGVTEHIILNYVFAIAAFVFAILSVLALRKGDVPVKSKIAFGVSTLLITLFIIVLFNWNFFVIS